MGNDLFPTSEQSIEELAQAFDMIGGAIDLVDGDAGNVALAHGFRKAAEVLLRHKLHVHAAKAIYSGARILTDSGDFENDAYQNRAEAEKLAEIALAITENITATPDTAATIIIDSNLLWTLTYLSIPRISPKMEATLAESWTQCTTALRESAELDIAFDAAVKAEILPADNPLRKEAALFKQKHNKQTESAPA